MKALGTVFFAVLVVFTPGLLAAATIYVDDDAPNDPGPGNPTVSDPLEDGTADHPFDAIQEGIDAAVGDDTVLVRDGTYRNAGNRELDFGGKAITVRSENGPEATVVDCGGNWRGVVFGQGETRDSVLEGFLIANSAGPDGAGILCDHSSPTIRDCTVRDCYHGDSLSSGSAIYIEGGSPLIEGCRILDNTGAFTSGGIGCSDASPEIRDCVIAGNEPGGVVSDGSTLEFFNCLIVNNVAGGGIWASGGSLHLTNCTIAGNTDVESGGGLSCGGDIEVRLDNCILWGNEAPDGHEVYAAYSWPDPVSLTFRYCDVQGGVDEMSLEAPDLDYDASNIETDPLFVTDWFHDYYCLSQTAAGQAADSPCADAGGDTAASLGLDTGSTRIDHLPDLGTVDIGYHHAAAGVYVDDDAPSDPGPGDPGVSDPLEDGSADHPFDSIQEAVNAVADGGTVLIRDGTYTGAGNRDIDFGGKAVAVRSENGAGTCIIDCEDSGRGFDFHSGEDRGSIVEGLTITGGYVEGADGGGVRCADSNPTILECVIRDCRSYFGGAVALRDSNPFIRGCTIEGNAATLFGGQGITCLRSSAEITCCVIRGNAGAGINIDGESTVRIDNCVVSGNGGTGISCSSPADVSITNCTLFGNLSGITVVDVSWPPSVANTIVWGNWARQIEVPRILPTGVAGESMAAGAGSAFMFRYCLIEDGTGESWFDPATCLDADPRLRADGRLASDSPCIDWCPDGTSRDIDGEARPLDVPGVGFDGPAARTYDIGADEFVDGDGNGLPDWWEAAHSSDPAGDPDFDDLPNQGEYDQGTDPDNPDTDGDGRSDGLEVAEGTDPLQRDGLFRSLYVDNDAPGDPGPNNPDLSDPLEDGSAAHPFDAIQEAIDVAVNDDEVVVLAGTYTGNGNRDIDFGGRAITVRGEEGAASTIIDCQGSVSEPHRGFSFHSTEDESSVVAGLTIRNGVAWAGGGICCEQARPTVRDCVFLNNGGASMDGGGVYCGWMATPTIVNCVFRGNTAHKGGAIACTYETARIVNCTIAGNTASHGGGVFCALLSSPELTNCIVWGNTPDEILAEEMYTIAAEPVVRYCDVRSGTGEAWFDAATCIDQDPLFCGSNTYRLLPGSPCIDRCPTGPAEDLDGTPRPIDIPGVGNDGAETYDMGAYEFQVPTGWSIDGLGDFDGDGKVDLLCRSAAAGWLEIWFMNGVTRRAGTALGPPNPDASWVIQGTGDFDGDGKDDIVWRNCSTSQLAVWLMNGTRLRQGAVVCQPAAAWEIAGTGDFDGDGRDDLLWRNTATGGVAIWLMRGLCFRSAGVVRVVGPGSGWGIAGTGDFDGDGRDDVLWHKTATGETAVWLMNGLRLRAAGLVGVVSPASGWSVVGTGDFDGDGRDDVLWHSSTTNRNAVWFMDGLGFRRAGLIPEVADANWAVAGCGDSNGDGRADIVWCNTETSDVAVWLMNGLAVMGAGICGNLP